VLDTNFVLHDARCNFAVEVNDIAFSITLLKKNRSLNDSLTYRSMVAASPAYCLIKHRTLRMFPRSRRRGVLFNPNP
jgi:hypothetical protein